MYYNSYNFSSTAFLSIILLFIFLDWNKLFEIFLKLSFFSILCLIFTYTVSTTLQKIQNYIKNLLN